MLGEPDEFPWSCDVCGETNFVLVEPASGLKQEFVEDCSVCCRPHLLKVTIDAEGDVVVAAAAEG